MFTNFGEFCRCVIEAKFGFEYLWQLLLDLYYSVTENPDISFIWSGLMSFLQPIIVIVPFVIMAFGIFVCFFGKKFGGILKFIGFFVLGFASGVYFLAPLISPEIPIPAWVVGLVVAVVAAVAFKVLFVALYSVSVLYSVYRLCYYGFFLAKEPVFSVGKAITSLAVAIVVLILSLIIFRFVEMLIMGCVGSWIFMTAFTYAIVDIAAWSWVAELIIACLIALVGFLVQIKTRRRY